MVERLLPSQGPFADPTESGLVGISDEWLVYTTFEIGPFHVERNHVWVHHIPSGATHDTGAVTEESPVASAYAPGARYVFISELFSVDEASHRGATSTGTGTSWTRSCT